MNAKTDRWESYTDKAGRRHWRWPAPSVPSARDGRDVDADSREYAGWPRQRREPPAEAEGVD
jgi:hypothetical protein